ncbi:MAG: hypothetical protein ACF8OB_05075 [Phycisphaeraceae bacterium JB051]
MVKSANVKSLLMLIITTLAVAACDAQTISPSPNFGNDFWKQWGDGKAEMAGYDIIYPRYGQLRKGTGVTIFVTEDFSDTLRVKADPGKHPKADVYPVIKLNLIEDFPTGLYDYSLMTSVFVRADNSEKGGLPVKASFSAQEWCGHAYAQLLFDKSSIRLTSHSYFDGEADQNYKLNMPSNAMSQDTLLHWARGLANPVLKPGQSVKVNMLMSMAHSRLRHQPLAFTQATLTFTDKPVEVTVPAGSLSCDQLTCTLADGEKWTFHVDRNSPYRPIVQWESSAGHKGQLIKSKRLPYWRLHDNGDESILSELGLKPRDARMP